MRAPQRAVVVAAAAVALLMPVAARAAAPASAPAAASTAGVISTVAGGVGGPGRATAVALRPCGVAFGAGRLYIGGGASVRAVDPGTDRLTTPAGTGVAGPLGDGRSGTRAGLMAACGAAVDHAGNLLIADTRHQRIRVVAASSGSFYGQAMTAGDIYTIAGNGTPGFAGDGGPATSAELRSPASVAVDAAGNLLIADTFNQRIRVAAASTGSFYGKAMTAGDIYTIAGTGTRGFAGDGGPATSAELNTPEGVAADAAGNLLIADTFNQRIRVAAASSGTFYGQAMTAGDIYTVAGTGTGGFAGDGGPATSAELSDPQGVAADAAGNLLIADVGNQRIRVVAAATGSFYGKAMTAGDIYTVAGTGRTGFAGDGGPATSAELSSPRGVAADAAGNLLIADVGNQPDPGGGGRHRHLLRQGDDRRRHLHRRRDGSSGFSGDGGPATAPSSATRRAWR